MKQMKSKLSMISLLFVIGVISIGNVNPNFGIYGDSEKLNAADVPQTSSLSDPPEVTGMWGGQDIGFPQEYYGPCPWESWRDPENPFPLYWEIFFTNDTVNIPFLLEFNLWGAGWAQWKLYPF